MLNATLALSDAAERCWDAVVVGAGPAGALAARSLAAENRAVLLIDKSAFPRAKVCGGCINHRAQHALESAGLGGLLKDLGAAPIETLTVAANAREASIPIPGYYGITRERLDEALAAKSVEAGAAFLPQTRALETNIQKDCRAIFVKQHETTTAIHGRVVIAANGLGAMFANEPQSVAPESRVGGGVVLDDAPAEFLPQRIYMACGKRGYVGLARVEDGRVDIAAAFDPPFIRDCGGLGPAAAAVFKEAGFQSWPALTSAAWRGTPALTRAHTKVTAERMYFIGDAAGYVEPFTGEGIAWALTTGLAVAPIAAQAVEQSNPVLERVWQKRYRQIVIRRQYICYALAYILRHPKLTTTVIRILSRMPLLARPLVTSVNATARTQKSS